MSGTRPNLGKDQYSCNSALNLSKAPSSLNSIGDEEYNTKQELDEIQGPLQNLGAARLIHSTCALEPSSLNFTMTKSKIIKR